MQTKSKEVHVHSNVNNMSCEISKIMNHTNSGQWEPNLAHPTLQLESECLEVQEHGPLFGVWPDDFYIPYVLIHRLKKLSTQGARHGRSLATIGQSSSLSLSSLDIMSLIKTLDHFSQSFSDALFNILLCSCSFSKRKKITEGYKVSTVTEKCHHRGKFEEAIYTIEVLM